MAIQKKDKHSATDNTKEAYTLTEAVQLVQKSTSTKFDASMDVAIRLGIDPKKSDQMVRGTVSLPHGTGKPCRILVLCTADKEQEARQAGADYVGLDDFIEKIAAGWTDIDLIITMPTVMVKLGRLGKILGPRGLMPNPKVGTVTMDVAKMVKEVKGGKLSFKVDKYGIVHSSVGRVSFPQEKVVENVMELLKAIVKLKPASSKGLYVNSISLSSTMSRGVFVDRSIAAGL
ncbi:50S ribosomal protein L1 [Cardinium endosymbiont cEper1 of Encarsia pergandiella]|uniref:50S ribosomal protein L1 n=1 Tax=Cardinium endosymbiont of Encarsia pergandiella TaxID=249402 RepID=UPI00027E9F3F|nr:50S ribosomal protein L1 [Cardinium endosymbiont of Encarsia pergandiella]CCM10112.1 50S ribosomal protein L1 [Cardinium endosymbiont cEper1 of Encarsia pergandiella]